MSFRHTVAATAATILTVSASAALFTSGASAHPGHPGQATDAPVVLFNETFEDNLADGANDPNNFAQIDAYKGGAYTADTPPNADWLDEDAGNGIILNGNIADAVLQGAAGFGTGNALHDSNLRALASAIGGVNGGGADNHVLSAYTNKPIAGNLRQFRTVNAITLPSGGRFLTASANAAAVNCDAGDDPFIELFIDDGAEKTLQDQPYLLCANQGAAAVAMPNGVTGNRAALTTSSSVSLVIRNTQNGGGGNDYAIDDLRLLDVTPQLDKAFAASSAKVRTAVNLVFTITNTSELGRKNGWSFTDNLPKNLTVAGPASQNGCSATVTANAQTSTITVTGGQLQANQASCTITVPVSSRTKCDTFKNSSANITSVGLNAPSSTPTTVKFKGCDDDDDSDDSDDDTKRALPATGAPTWANPWLGGTGLLLTAVAAGTAVAVRRRTAA